MRVILGFIVFLGGIVSPSVYAQENLETWESGWNTPFSSQLANAGVVPTQRIEIAGATFYLSKPYALDEFHQIAVAWISVRDQKSVRALYRSNSQCCWRMCDAMAASHIGKGFHEFDKNAPIDVTIALLRSASDLGTLISWNASEKLQMTQEMLAQELLEMLTVQRDAGTKSGDVITVGNHYVSKEYASWIPLFPQPFSNVSGSIKTLSGREVADPANTTLPPPALLPDFGTIQASVKFQNPAYAKFTRSDGELAGKVYRSLNGRIRYFFVEDSQKRVFLSCVEDVESPVCILGLRTQYLDIEGMDAPLLEYGFQIPERFGGKKQSRYQLNWNWVRSLPIIAHYYLSTGQEMPESL